MSEIVSYRGSVYPWHCDQMGHMNVMFYVGKFDEATWHLMAAVGITPAYVREMRSGMAGVQQNITYKRELLAGDIVEIRSRIMSIGDRKMAWVHDLYDAQTGELCAVCELTGVHIDRTERRATPFPPEVRARAEAMIAAPRPRNTESKESQ
ncbi:MAG TPA: thioesterase family protein [Candidatus Binatia bacterium]|nr:thioesterase family protein [Candidatus Binatia bacterium]